MTGLLVLLFAALLVASVREDRRGWRRRTDYAATMARPQVPEKPLDVSLARVVRHHVRRIGEAGWL